MKSKDISAETARIIARHLQLMYLSPETRRLMKQKSEQRKINENELFAEAFLALWKTKKQFDDAALNDYLQSI